LDRGTLTGLVTDPQGATVAGANVTVRSEQTNAVYKTTTTQAGDWQVANLPIGTYEVTVESNGFKQERQTGVDVGATEVVRVDSQLILGSTSDSVSVQAQVSSLQTDSAETGSTLENKQYINLPLPYVGGRVLDQLSYKIMPGVNGVVGAATINGSTIMSRDSLVDGATITTYRGGDPRDGAFSPEAVQEFKVQTSGMSAEFGRTSTSIFNYVLKSGANQLHGSVFASFRNEDLNTNTFANKARGLPRSLDRKQDVAGSFGGPVYIPKVYDGHNKTFFYATYELYRERTPGVGAPSVTEPIPAFYNGDFSRLLGPSLGVTDALGRPVLKGAVYDPATFRQLPNGRWVGEIFPGNKIPVSRFSQVSQKLDAIAQKYYTPTITDSTGQIALVNNASFPISSTPSYDTHHFSLKMDQNMNDAQKLSGSFIYRYAPKLAATGNVVSNQLWNSSFADGGPLSAASNQLLHSYAGRLAHDWTINPRTLNHLTLYYNRVENPFQTTHTNLDASTDLGLSGLSTAGIPGINWGSGPYVSLTPAGGNNHYFQAYVSYGLIDTVSFSRGRHFMKAGFDARRYQFNNKSFSVGAFNFSPAATAIPGEVFSGNQTGYSFASYLLGIVDSGFLNAPSSTGSRSQYYALFFQDDFKVSDRLTLNLGLRWEYEPRFTEAANRMSSFDFNAVDPKSGLKGAYSYTGDCSVCNHANSFGRSSGAMFGPRIGFAYRVTPKTVVRSAYGIFYEGTNFNGSLPSSATAQAYGTWNLSQNAANPWQGLFNWDNGFPQGFYTPPGLDPSYPDRATPFLYGYGPSPYIQQWNFSVQRDLGKGVVFEAVYIGNKGTRLHAGELARINQLQPVDLSLYGRTLNSSVQSATDAAKYGIAYPFAGFKGTVASALRPYPQVVGNSTINAYGSPLGFSTYEGVQLIARKEFGNGLYFNFNYVREKSLGNVFSSTPGDNSAPLDYYNLKLQKAVTNWDYPWTVKATVSYDLPVGRTRKYFSNMNRLADLAFGGWTVTAILNYLPGLPLTFTSSNPLVNGWNGGPNRPNAAPGPMTVNVDQSSFNLLAPASSTNRYLNKAVFSDPGPLQLGNSALHYTQARGFASPNEDLSLLKNVFATERVRIQLRAEALNAFNRTILGGIITDTTNPLFGQVTSTSGNRQLQLGMRLEF
jgi:hypothetical protein